MARLFVSMQKLWLSKLSYPRNNLSQDKDSSEKMDLDDICEESSEKRYFHALFEANVVVVGSGQNAAKVLPWAHPLIANIKSNIRGAYHGVSSKHLMRYLSEFCYRFNWRFWEPQMFDRLLSTCVNTSKIKFAELRT